MTDHLTAVQLRTLRVILQAAQQGHTLTVRELMERMGWRSLNASTNILAKLRQAGLITWEPFASRTLRPTCRLAVFEEVFQTQE